jgi:hypothetical protein
MARRGGNRNKAHRARTAARLAQAGSDWERLGVSYDAFRAAVRLLARRQQQDGTRARWNRAQADRLVAEVAGYLAGLAERIDAGTYDAVREAG